MRRLYLFYILSLCFIQGHSISLEEVRFNNEEVDTIKISSILSKAAKIDNPSERIVNIAKQFINTPYAAGTLEGNPERLTINLDSLDCTTFVETVLALTLTANEQHPSWRYFIHNLERIRYRNGNLNGYASRLHYISDWIVDNSYRGIITEATGCIPHSKYTTKSLDFMTSNREKYPALTDDTEFIRIQEIEMGYRSHQFPYINREKLSSKEINNTLKDGDIIAITTSIRNLDVTHMGIIVKIDNTPHLLHASSAAGKVIIDPRPLYDYVCRSKLNTGIRVIRLNH